MCTHVQRRLSSQHAEAMLLQLRQCLWSRDHCFQREHNAAHTRLTSPCKAQWLAFLTVQLAVSLENVRYAHARSNNSSCDICYAVTVWALPLQTHKRTEARL